MEHRIENKQYDEERALYNQKDTQLVNCVFAGPADGESALKEARNVSLTGCDFSLRYPLWHVEGFSLDNCSMDEKTRAAIWYAKNGKIQNSNLGGIKALRECQNIAIRDSKIHSLEFGWKCDGVSLEDTQIHAEYLFLDSRNIRLDRVQMSGKYSFQYVENLEIVDSVLDTKDAFWHAKNVTIKDSVIKGEYLAWYSENLTFIDCTIKGTQPLCYCKGLKLINCRMEDCDLAFERSDVEATILTPVISIKNPLSGSIKVPSVGEIIRDIPGADGKVITG